MIERDDLARKLVATAEQTGSRVRQNAFGVFFPNVTALRNAGLDVYFRLDRRLKGESAFTAGDLSDKYEMNVPLGPSDPTGLYVFNMVLTPTNDLTRQAVLASVATVGVLRVTSPATNTVVAVPWMSMDTVDAANAPVKVAEAVNPNGLSAGDRIYAYVASNGTFNAWTLASDGSWGAVPAGTSGGVAVTDATTNRLERGSAFWLVRSNPGSAASTNHVYLVGRYTGDGYTVALEGGTAAEPGFTPVANPTADAVALGDLAFVDGSGDSAVPAAGDRIVFQDAAGFQRVWIRNAANTAWGRPVSRKTGGHMAQEWVSGAAVPIPPGTGFWYVRTETGPLAIRFGGAE